MIKDGSALGTGWCSPHLPTPECMQQPYHHNQHYHQHYTTTATVKTWLSLPLLNVHHLFSCLLLLGRGGGMIGWSAGL
jgi:hypothetical protein